MNKMENSQIHLNMILKTKSLYMKFLEKPSHPTQRDGEELFLNYTEFLKKPPPEFTDYTKSPNKENYHSQLSTLTTQSLNPNLITFMDVDTPYQMVFGELLML